MTTQGDELGGAGMGFEKVRFSTPIPNPPEEDVEYTLNGGDIASERKTIDAPTENPEDILPGPGTSNRQDVQAVDVYIQPRGYPTWHRYQFQAGSIINELVWNQDVPIGQVPTNVQGLLHGNPVPGNVVYMGELPEAPPPG